MRTIFRSVMLGAGLLGSSAAMAGATGNAGAVSTYMFRGIDQSLGAAVQGGVDIATDSGVYGGIWASTTAPAVAGSAYETDIYGGWAGGGFDVGYIFYGYRDTGLNNFSEVYAGWSGAGVSAKVYFSPEFAATEEDGIYATVSYAITLSDSLTLTPQVGFSSGDGVELALGDTYADYSVTLGKALDNGFVFALAYTANSLESDPTAPDFSAFSEEGQVTVGLKKTFGL